ncbi:MAG: enoyl-CoA hydratase-related protein [Dehalococcoidia bacterium]|jgi:enoyl-CoA hydratase|nr:enoyl-CoA hydratase-related protein [Dehalococcoidia bacterium]MDP7469218.1 enoyl-CoA hydratase-related protein [Dehalococcoidia bacterium]
MNYQHILYDKDGKVARITLNRPGKLNALTQDLLAEFEEALFERAEADPKVRVVVVQGAGRAFSTGYDASEGTITDVATTTSINHDREHMVFSQERWWRIRQFPKPLIAQVHGYCLAGATQLAMACDIIIVAEDAVVGNVQAGPMGAGVLGAEFAWQVGAKRAKEIMFVIGSRIDGREAERIGWANRAVPPSQLEAEVTELALRISKTPQDMLAIEKVAINRMEELMGLRAGMLYAGDLDTIAHYTPVVQQFLAAIKEKGIKGARN